MEIVLKVGVVNQVEENCIIYRQGQILQSVALVLKGTVTLHNTGCKMILGPGNFIGIHDLYLGKYSFTCETNEACSIYIFKGRELSDLGEILEQNKDYKGYMLKTLNRIICNLNDDYYNMKSSANDIYDEVKEVVSTYKNIVLAYGGTSKPIQSFQRLTEFNKSLPVKEEWLEGIREMQQVPAEVMANYYSYLPNLSMKELEEKIKIITILIEQLQQVVSYVNDLSASLFNDGNDCIFKILCQEVMLLAPSHENYSDLIEMVDKSVDLVNKIETSYEESMGRSIFVNRAMMEKIYFAVIAEKDVSGLMADNHTIDNDSIIGELTGSLDQILSYGRIEPEMGTHFKQCIDRFLALSDKQLVTDETRVLRKEISKDFYAIYEKVFKMAYTTQQYSKVIELFLNFGFMDERLITKEQALELYRFKISYTDTYYCNCYTMFEWLTLIYKGIKEPSKNDLDMDYADYVRHLKMQGKLSPAEVESEAKDKDKKLNFEINNMFSLNMRLVNGKISTFIPVLHSDIMPLNMGKYFVTYTAVDEAVRDICKKDFSLFYQEVLYSNPSVGINKEMIVKKCLPDIIIFPTCGANGSMWQEIEGKRRESAGRFCISIFHEGSLYDTIIKLAGRYRWELCRTMQGVAWNDIKNKCLTSEYSDYIQFYRKNKDLTEDKKEKVKQQIVKARNSLRECFVIDYEQWMKYECGGALRLSKPARDIVSMYCPFSRDIRKNLINRPVFSESMYRYEKEAHGKVRILEAKALGITKKGNTVPKEITDTIYYYERL